MRQKVGYNLDRAEIWANTKTYRTIHTHINTASQNPLTNTVLCCGRRPCRQIENNWIKIQHFLAVCANYLTTMTSLVHTVLPNWLWPWQDSGCSELSCTWWDMAEEDTTHPAVASFLAMLLNCLPVIAGPWCLMPHVGCGVRAFRDPAHYVDAWLNCDVSVRGLANSLGSLSDMLCVNTLRNPLV